MSGNDVVCLTTSPDARIPNRRPIRSASNGPADEEDVLFNMVSTLTAPLRTTVKLMPGQTPSSSCTITAPTPKAVSARLNPSPCPFTCPETATNRVITTRRLPTSSFLLLLIIFSNAPAMYTSSLRGRGPNHRYSFSHPCTSRDANSQAFTPIDSICAFECQARNEVDAVISTVR